MGKKWAISIILVFFSCAASTSQFTVDYDKLPPKAKAYFGSKDNLSSRLFILSHYGLPFLAGDLNHSRSVFDVEDLFIRDKHPPYEEVWTWEDCRVTFYSLADLAYEYVPPEYPPGEVQLKLTDTCTTEDGQFCIEFRIDGLKEDHHATLYKVQILARAKDRKKGWLYLYDTSPIVGRTGLRSVQLTAFADSQLLSYLFLEKPKRKKAEVMFLIVIWDFLSSEKREAVFELSLTGRRG